MNFKKTRLCKFRKLDYKKLFYFYRFNKIPYKDHFIFTPSPRLTKSFINLDVCVYSGKRWFKVRVTRWNVGLSTKFFIWPKRPSVFKKKNKKVKKK